MSMDSENAEKTVRTFDISGVCFKMVKVEGGTFQMGHISKRDNNIDIGEEPVHSVTLSDYHIGQTQVTQELLGSSHG